MTDETIPYRFTEYPRCLYRPDPAKPWATWETCLVHSDAEKVARLEAGWLEAPPEVVPVAPPAPADEPFTVPVASDEEPDESGRAAEDAPPSGSAPAVVRRRGGRGGRS